MTTTEPPDLISNNKYHLYGEWNKRLATRGGRLQRFSPAVDINPPSGTPESFHGLGLTVAYERSKALSATGKSCSSLLAEISSATEAYSKKIEKACENFSSSVSLLEMTNALPSRSGEPSTPPPPPPLCNLFQQSLVSFAKQNRFVSITLKSNVARPISADSSAYEATCTERNTRYVEARRRCVKVRASLLKDKSKYHKKVEETESLFSEVMKAYQDVEARKERSKRTFSASSNVDEDPKIPADPNPPTSPTKAPESALSDPNSPNPTFAIFSPESYLTRTSEKLYACINSVKTCEETYRVCLMEDIAAVKAADNVEKEVLTDMEVAEVERLNSFLDSMKRLVLAEDGALKNMHSAIERFLSTNSEATTGAHASALPLPPITKAFVAYTTPVQERSSPNNARRMAESDQHNPISGNVYVEADANGLPPRVAQLRSDLVALWKRGSGVIQFLSALKKIVASLQSATDAFCLGLSSVLTAAGYPTPEKGGNPSVDPTSLCMTIVKAEGPRCFQVWSSVVSSVASQIRFGRAMLSALNEALEENLPATTISEGEKSLKQFKDTSDIVWKGVCEGGRNLSRAETKWTQCEVEVNKTRDKLKSVKTEFEREREILGAAGVEGEEVEVEGFGGMRRALGHVLNSLGTGDNLLSTKERLDLAEKAFEKAKVNMSESKENLNKTTQHVHEKYEAYVKHFQEMFKLHRKSEVANDEIGGRLLNVVAKILKDFVLSREKNIEEARSTVEKAEGGGGEGILEDKVQWAKKIEKKIKNKMEEEEDGSGHTIDYDVSLELKGESRQVYTVLRNVLEYNPQDMKVKRLEAEEQVDCDIICSLLQNVALGEVEGGKKGSIKEREQQVFEDTFKGFWGSEGGGTEEQGEGEGEREGSEEGEKKEEEGEGGVGGGDGVEVEEGKLAQLLTEAPRVVQSFSCAYWPRVEDSASIPSPLLHGRLYVTASAMYFVGWGKFKLSIQLEHIKSVSKERTAGGALDNALLLVDVEGKEFFFGSFAFRDTCISLIERLRSVKEALIEGGFVEAIPVPVEEAVEEESDEEGEGDGEEEWKGVALKKDEPISKMNSVVTGTLRGINVRKFWLEFWRDKGGSEFYKPWLEAKGSKEINVTGWKKGSWDHKYSGETFEYKRVATFQYPRTTHLWMGPPMAGVTQTQYATVKDGKCVITMTVEMNGIPYADVFAVEVRWVASNVNYGVLEVEVGVDVDFKKSSMFKSQIKSGTIEETGAIHKSIFESIEKGMRDGGMWKEGEVGGQGGGGDMGSGKIVVEGGMRKEEVRMLVGGMVAVLVVMWLMMLWDLRAQRKLVVEMLKESKEMREELGRLVNALGGGGGGGGRGDMHLSRL